jgi:ligand-binding sensor domain-containing protein
LRILKCFIPCLFFYNYSFAQLGDGEYIYKQYNKLNGLSADEIYDIVQDSSHFIWIGTNTGLFRFDGKKFTQFTTVDGLPSNEVIKLFVDKSNKLWIATLKPKLCYYQGGQFNIVPDEDRLLEREIITFGADDDGNMICTSGSSLLQYRKNKLNRVYAQKQGVVTIFSGRTMDQFGFDEFEGNKEKYDFEIALLNKSPVIIDEQVYFLTQGKLQKTIYRVVLWKIDTIRLYVNDRFFGFDLSQKNNITTNILIKDRKFMMFPDYVLESSFFKNVKEDTLFKGFVVNTLFMDKEGCYWAGGVNTGLLKIIDKKIRKGATNGSGKSIRHISGKGDDLLLASDNSKLLIESKNQHKIVNLALSNDDPNNITQRSINRVREIIHDSSNRYLVITDASLHWMEKDRLISSNLSFNGLKAACIYKSNIFLATKWGIFLLDKNLAVIDTLFIGRTVSVAAKAGSVYVGSNMGLHVYDTQKKRIVAHYLDSFQINKVYCLESNTYIGTENGLYYLDVKNNIHEASGLNSKLTDKNINCFARYGQFLFVGTNEGLFRINMEDKTERELISYKVADGILDNKINTIYINKDLVYIGTPNGVCFFDVHTQTVNSICTLNLLKFSVDGEVRDFTQHVSLGSNARNINIDFVAVAPKSNGEVTYYYQLEGFDDSVKTTMNDYLTYAKLPSGNYHLSIYAINKNGVRSAVKELYFDIAKPFWLRWWFLVPIFCVLGIVIFVLYKRHIYNLRQKMAEKERIKTLIAESEQKALRAQMNPHFIYNCLNSIQQFFISNDLENGNRYMTRFGTLLRQTLQNSEKQYITIQEESNYIKTYIELEQLRFSNSFTYSIEIDEVLLHNNALIPSMVIQPFVENAIEHGLHYKTSGVGKIEIKFRLDKNQQAIECEITDNGIGLTKSTMLKQSKITTHQSKGIGITKSRLQVLNMGKEEKVNLTINEQFDEEGNSKGTTVGFQFPYFDI